MFLELEFEELEGALDLEFEQVTEISDGGFDRGFEEGYKQGNTDGYTTGKTEGESIGFADAIAKRTELVVTDSGEYVPEGESTGFKKVTVGIQKGEDLDAVVAEQAELIEELSATLDEKIGAYDVGYDAAIEKLTDLVVTKNGEYTPSEDSTGFKRVSVNVQAKSAMDAFIEGATTKVSSGATKVARYVFRNDTIITSANFPNATSIGESAFQSCTKMTSANFPEVLIVEKSVFQTCSAMTSANFPKLSKVWAHSFRECKKLVNVEFPAATGVGYYAMYYCEALETVDLPKVKQIEGYAFNNCYLLKSVILRSETVCTLDSIDAFGNCYHIDGTVNSTYNPNGDQDGYFYVPRSLVESYKAATNWSTFSTQFRALEDYTVDGTITGALDPNKI